LKDERGSISAFFKDAQKAYDECYKDTEIYGTPLPAELIVKGSWRKKTFGLPKRTPPLLRLDEQNLQTET